jgi:4-amino-4-deoxy-L-arabinose transferase-like glycosyltransferase
MTALIFSLWWDNIHWNVTPMTESLFCSLTCFLIYRLSRFKNSSRDFVIIFILLSIGISLRPTGMLLIAGVLAFLLRYYWQDIKSSRPVIVSLGIGIIFTLLISTHYLFQMWDFSEQYVKGNIVTYVDVNEADFNTSGLRVLPRHPEAVNTAGSSIERIILFIYHNPSEFIKAAFLKVFFLLSGIRPYYSTLHNLFTILWMLFIYTGFYFGIRKSQLTPLVVFVLAVVILNCVLIGISTVDWDNRFYIPMEPGIVLITGAGILKMVGVNSE